MNLRLVAPTDRLRATFLRALAEFRREGLPWWRGGDVDLAERDFAAFVVKKLAAASTNVAAGVPATHLWAVAGDDEAMVGRISIRHALDDALYVSADTSATTPFRRTAVEASRRRCCGRRCRWRARSGSRGC